MPKLADAQELLTKADLHAFFPPGSRARLVRSAFVNCSTTGCDLILAPVIPPGTTTIRPTVIQLPRNSPK